MENHNPTTDDIKSLTTPKRIVRSLRNMKRFRYILLIMVTLLSCVGCDQAAKSVAKNYLPRGDAVSLFGDTVRLVYTENPGAFLSLGASLPEHVRVPLFTIGVSVIVVGTFAALLVSPRLSVPVTFGLALIGAGGASNLIDRVVYDGHVIDFLNVGVGALRTGIFNVADMAITLGAILIMVSAVERKRKFGF